MISHLTHSNEPPFSVTNKFGFVKETLSMTLAGV